MAANRDIVLVHGMWEDGASLASLGEFFEELGFGVHLPTLPGHEPGSSPSDVATRSLAEYRDAVIEYVQALAPQEPPVLLGHSMGGLVAQMASPRLDLAALVLLAPAPPRGINAMTPSSGFTTSNVFTRWRFWAKPHTPPAWLARFGILNRLDEAGRQRVLARLRPESGRAYFEIVFSILDRARTTAVDASAIRCPIFLAAGGRDRIIRPSVVRAVARKYESAGADLELRWYPHAGHWLFEEESRERLLADLRAWLAARALLDGRLRDVVLRPHEPARAASPDPGRAVPTER